MAISILMGIVIVLLILKNKQINKLSSEADSIISSANEKALKIEMQSKKQIHEQADKARKSVEEEVKSRRATVEQIEKRVLDKERNIEHKEQTLIRKEEVLEQSIEKNKNLKVKQENIIKELISTLEKAAGFSQEEAKKILLTNVERDMRVQAGKLIKDTEEKARKIANQKAKEIVTAAIQRTAVDHAVASTTSSVKLPDEEMKGRIIGREGRNIRAFESATGVDIIIDDSPETVVLSSFNPIRREIAKRTLEKLLLDGRINPARIEETIEISKSELGSFIRKKGEETAEELGLQFHPKLLEYIGKLYY